MKASHLLKKTASGIITGGADNDPSGITTYSVTGATTGFSQGWLLLLSTPFLIVVQGMSAKIGDVKRKGLTTVIEEHFGRKVAIVSLVLLLIVNTLAIGADLSIMGSVLNNFISFVPSVVFIPLIALIIWYVVVFENYKVLYKILLWLVVVFLSYVAAGVLAKPDWGLVARETLFPKVEFTPLFFAAATALLGTTITPFLFFWQTSEEIEDRTPKQEARKKFLEVTPGFIFSNVIAYFIIISTASALYFSGAKVEDVNALTAADISKGLIPVAGDSAFFLFSIGIIGGGLLALPVLAASSSYAAAEIFGWREGLDQKVSKAKGFYAILTSTFFIGAAIAVLGINPVTALFYSQVLAGIVAPPLLVLIILISSNKEIMGEYVNSLFTQIIGWGAVVVMSASVIFMFGSWFFQ